MKVEILKMHVTNKLGLIGALPFNEIIVITTLIAHIMGREQNQDLISSGFSK